MAEIDTAIEKVIQETVKRTVEEIKKNGLLKEGSAAYKKTEQVLYSYVGLKLAVRNQEGIEPVKPDRLEIIEKALLYVKQDPYFPVIVHRYFEEKTIDEIADIMNVDNKTVSRNKTRLINKLKVFLFPDDTMKELLFE